MNDNTENNKVVSIAKTSIVSSERTTIDNAIKNAFKTIWVSFTKEGIHCYPAAATDPKLATGDWDDVFHFKVWIEVFHDDRDIEFIQFKRWLESLYNANDAVLRLDFKSCEMIADDLYLQISSRYPGRKMVINVSEDNENGCEISY